MKQGSQNPHRRIVSHPPVLSFINTKGGVGKTHLSAFLSGIYAGMGLRVLMIDADADQASLTQFYEIAHQAPQGIAEMVVNGGIDPSMISEVKNEGLETLDLICANDCESQLRPWLSKRMDQFVRLRDCLSSPFVSENYDLVIIDTKGNGGPLEDSAAVASSQIISPIVPDIVSTREFLSGTLELVDKLQQLKSIGIDTIPPIRAVIYRMERTRNAAEVAKLLREAIAQKNNSDITICQTVIPNAVAFTQAASERVPIQKLLRGRIIPKKEIELMQRLAWEILPTYSLCFAEGVNFEVDEAHNEQKTQQEE